MREGFLYRFGATKKYYFQMKRLALIIILCSLFIGCEKETEDAIKPGDESTIKDVLYKYKDKPYLGKFTNGGCDGGVQYATISKIGDKDFTWSAISYGRHEIGLPSGGTFDYEHLKETDPGVYEGTYTIEKTKRSAKINTINNTIWLEYDNGYSMYFEEFTSIEGVLDDYRPSLGYFKSFVGTYTDTQGELYNVVYEADPYRPLELSIKKWDEQDDRFYDFYSIGYSQGLEWDSNKAIVYGPWFCRDRMEQYIRLKDNKMVIGKLDPNYQVKEVTLTKN